MPEDERRHGEAVGSMAEEAAKLAAILEEWSQRSGAPFGLAELFNENIATGAPECRVCPICRFIAAARDLGPDFYSNLGTAVSGLLAAAAADSKSDKEPASDGDAADDDSPAAGGASSSRSPAPGPRTPKVERLDLDGYDE
jgi:hypothetical protein